MSAGQPPTLINPTTPATSAPTTQNVSQAATASIAHKTAPTRYVVFRSSREIEVELEKCQHELNRARERERQDCISKQVRSVADFHNILTRADAAVDAHPWLKRFQLAYYRRRIAILQNHDAEEERQLLNRVYYQLSHHVYQEQHFQEDIKRLNIKHTETTTTNTPLASQSETETESQPTKTTLHTYPTPTTKRKMSHDQPEDTRKKQNVDTISTSNTAPSTHPSSSSSSSSAPNIGKQSISVRLHNGIDVKRRELPFGLGNTIPWFEFDLKMKVDPTLNIQENCLALLTKAKNHGVYIHVPGSTCELSKLKFHLYSYNIHDKQCKEITNPSTMLVQSSTNLCLLSVDISSLNGDTNTIPMLHIYPDPNNIEKKVFSFINIDPHRSPSYSRDIVAKIFNIKHPIEFQTLSGDTTLKKSSNDLSRVITKPLSRGRKSSLKKSDKASNNDDHKQDDNDDNGDDHKEDIITLIG